MTSQPLTVSWYEVLSLNSLNESGELTPLLHVQSAVYFGPIGTAGITLC